MDKSANAITANSRGAVPKNGLYILDDSLREAKNDAALRGGAKLASAPHYYAAAAGSNSQQPKRTEHRNDGVVGSGDGIRPRSRGAHSHDSVAHNTMPGGSIPARNISKKRSVASTARGNKSQTAQNGKPSASPEARTAAAPVENKPIAASASSIAKEREVMNETLNALLQAVLGKNGFVAPTDHRGYSAMIAKAVKQIKNPAQLEAFKAKIEEAGKPFKLNFGLSRSVEGKTEALNARSTGSLDAEHIDEYKKIVTEFQSKAQAPAQTVPSTAVPNQVPAVPASAQPVPPSSGQVPGDDNGLGPVQNQAPLPQMPQAAPQPEVNPTNDANPTTNPGVYGNPDLIA